MHIPDGFLDAKTWIGLDAVAVAGIGLSLKKIRSDELYASRIPLIGMVSAFIFATQMINFPIAGATSGHLDGAALASVLFGPWIGMLIMATVVTIQAFFFQDGGITALGANIVNMGIVASLSGYAVYGLFRYVEIRWVRLTGVFIASWTAVVMASAAASAELAVSGTIPFAVVLKAMLTWHSLIGIGEGIITTGVLLYLSERNPAFGPLSAQKGG
jgi:cobalt/nickel transport system permease protein